MLKIIKEIELMIWKNAECRGSLNFNECVILIVMAKIMLIIDVNIKVPVFIIIPYINII